MRHYDLWIERYNQRRTQIIEVLKKHHEELSSIKDKIPEGEIIQPLAKRDCPEPSSMCFVDGGEGYNELVGVGVYFIRAASLVMSKNIGKKFVRDLDIGVISYDENTKDRVELLRESMELDVALKTIKEYRPEYVFLDGSLYVKATRKPIECGEYSTYIRKFYELLGAAKKYGAVLVGVSEDSKSRLLKQYLNMKYNVSFPDFFTDPTILEVITAEKEYSTIKLQLNKDGTTYITAYLKVHKLASPLRVDATGCEDEFDDILSLVKELSRGSQHYGYPIPLYLAHLDAKIDAKHADWSSKKLKHHTVREYPELGEAIFGKTRRDLRPKKR